MSKIRKLMVVCAMALMMMVVALPSALAQSYYWDPSWLGTPSSTDTATEPTWDDCDWERGWAWDYDEEEWVPVWVCD